MSVSGLIVLILMEALHVNAELVTLEMDSIAQVELLH
jgi:hypothetical protein